MTDIRTRPFADLSDSGVLWAINRCLFHPRGYALTLVYDDEDNCAGWFIQGDGTEVWHFDEETDDAKFFAFERTLRQSL